MNTKDWIVVPTRGKPQELSEDQSYPKLLELMREVDLKRGHLLTDKQANVLQAVIQGMINARARLTIYEEEQ